MVAPRYRSRTFRRRRTRTPGSRQVIHYLRRRPSQAECGTCRAILKGVPHGNVSKIKALPKSARRPERPYGGVLCSKCMRSHFKLAARKE